MSSQQTQTAPGMTWEDEQRLKLWIVDKIGESLDSKLPQERTPETMQLISERFNLLCSHGKINLTEPHRSRIQNEVLDELLGFGPIEPLLQDDSLTEVMVNGPDEVYIEREGKLIRTKVRFLDDDHVVRVIKKIIKPLRRSIDRKWPMVDARLPDGSRVNAIIPPCAIDGPSVTIRKFAKERLTVQDLIRFGSLTDQMAQFLKACVVSRLNIVISGGTGSGKTTLLNVLSGYIPDEDRIVTIEDAAELQLSQTHVVRLETKHAAIGDDQAVKIRDLVINSLRMRPDRIVVGECRGGEALDMLQAMNTGHDGSLTTVHANSPRDSIARLETLVLMAGMELPVSMIRRQLASAVQMIVQVARLRDGSRRVVNVTEVQGMEGDTVVLQDVFIFEELGEEGGRVKGRVKPTGIRPSFMPLLISHGFNLPASVFMDSGAGR